MKVITIHSKDFQKICNRGLLKKQGVKERVSKILEDIRLYGDDAIIKYTKKFDKVSLSSRQLKVSASEISGAYQNISPNLASTLKHISDSLTRFYKRQIKKSWKMKAADGVILGEIMRPLERVGVYVPSGTAPLVSTVYMTVLPAKLAGVKEIVIVCPPNKSGSIDPHILVVADLLKVDAVYKIGGAQAIAALAYGTKTIPKVDKIVGPGNIYVTEAKRQVFGVVDIDMLAGPTEVVIIANNSTPVNFIMADLESQSEHSKGLSILITPSKPLAKLVSKQVKSGYVIKVKNLDEAADASNKIAPEHLEIMIRNPKAIFKKIKNAGAIFIGPYSPAVVGDYIAGPSHVLPTAGTAKFFSGLSVCDFVKASHIIHYSKTALENSKDAIEKIAMLEGMTKHLDAVKVRF
jgi:histidinol dehydrogenase